MKQQLTFCSIEWTQRGACVTFPSGRNTEAYPHPEEPHYHVIAHRCGYGDDLLAYCREHELAHCVVMEHLFAQPSFVLNAQVHGIVLESGVSALEELAAQALQRWARTNERPIIGGIDWDRMRTTFLFHADRLNGGE